MTALPANVDPTLLSNLYLCNPVRYAEHVSHGAWVAYKWLEFLGEAVTRTVLKDDGRLLVAAPPRRGKSSLMSLWTPAWIMDRWPDQRVIISTNDKELSLDWGRKIRDQAAHNERCHIKLSPDSTAAGRWNTAEGGGVLAKSLGATIVGFGFHLGIIDDITKDWEQAWSRAHQKRLRDWLPSTFMARAEPGASVIVMQQRWHEADAIGYLMEESKEEWEYIELPDLAEPGDAMGRAPGEPLCPERFSKERCEEIKRVTPRLIYNAVYGQKPLSKASSRVYDKYTGKNLDKSIELDVALPLDIAIDFNINPGMHATVGQHSKRLDMVWAHHQIHGPRMRIDPMMAEFFRLLESLGHLTPLAPGQTEQTKAEAGFAFPHLEIFGDSTGKNENVQVTETSYQQIEKQLNARGIKYRRRVKAKNPPLRSSIDAVNDALSDNVGRISYKIHPRCKLLIRDYKELPTDEKGLIDKTDQELSHPSDGERYRVDYIRPLVSFLLPRRRGRIATG